MNFQDELMKLRQLATINEDVKRTLERMTGKELVSYEGVDELVKALMTHYNGELKNKAQSSHTHNLSDIQDNWKIHYKQIENNTDLNNITESGIYRNPYSDNIVKNNPFNVGGGHAFILIVTKIQDTDDYTEQIAIDYYKAQIAVRVLSKYDSNDWTKWVKLATTDSMTWDNIQGKPSSFNPSSHTHPYLPTSGGTVSGNLTVTGQIVSNGDVTAFSDKDLKENIKPLKDNLLDKLKVYSYNYKDKQDIRYGIIAQELQEIYPNLVVETDTEINGRKALAVRDRDIVYLLLDGYKKLLKRVEELEGK